MDCPICAKPNPDENAFCGKCGATLNDESRRLVQQIRGVVEREYKDQELVSVSIADKAEDRLWRLGKVLGLAASIAAIGLGFFGFTTVKGAQARIDDAADLATKSVTTVSQKTQRTIEEAASSTISTMQQQSTLASSRTESVVLRAKSSDAELSKLEVVVQEDQKRTAYLNAIREQSPNTPIGNINGGLFGYNPYAGGIAGIGGSVAAQQAALYQNVGGEVAKAATEGIVVVYKKDSSGPGVESLQRRLLDLKCAVLPLEVGGFDGSTADAVSEFVKLNGRHSVSVSEGDTSKYAPSSLVTDKTDGVVDGELWREIFSTTAKPCNLKFTE